MPKRPVMPEHTFTPEQITQFTTIIADRINMQLTPGVTNRNVEDLLNKMVKAASLQTRESRAFHKKLDESPRATVNIFVDNARAEEHAKEREEILRRPTRSTSCTAGPSAIQAHGHVYGLRPSSNGPRKF